MALFTFFTVSFIAQKLKILIQMSFFFFFASRFLEKMFKIIVDSHAVVKSITEISRYSQNTEHFHYHEAPSVALLATLTSLVPGPPL